MSVKDEIWQVMIQGEVYEADIESLKQWVAEGRVLPTDHVRKGKLSWIQADRAPAMRRIFSEKDCAPSSSLSVSTVCQDAPATAMPQSFVAVGETTDETVDVGVDNDSWTAMPAAPPVTDACYNHPESSPKYVCRVCGNAFCRECPNFIGVTKIALCPLCGDLCQPYQKLVERSALAEYRNSGFGLEDFGRALGYPLKSIISLIAAAILYGFLLMAGFWGQIAAYAIMFGCISLVINRVSAGKMDRNFMPDFSSFSWWDDVFVPAGLGVGIFIVTMGPTIVLVVALWFGVVGGASSVPVNPAQVQQEQLTQEDMDELVNGTDGKKSEEAAKKIDQLHPGRQISEEMEKTKDSSKSLTNLIAPFLYAALPIILLFALALCWMVFYYPMALAVAGYTGDFWATVNPLVGLDTIRRMGLVYVKAFLMYLCVEVVGIVVGAIIYVVTAPFDIPLVGNLPATFLNGMVTFYINLVIACILGLALYKCADKLDIPTD